jgi:putative ATP-binding cassette transporter
MSADTVGRLKPHAAVNHMAACECGVWDQQLPLDEQQRLAFARLLLHAPRWVVADDALSALGDSHRRRVLSFCERELVGVTLIRLGRDSVLNGFWSRTLHTIERPGGPSCAPTCRPGPAR